MMNDQANEQEEVVEENRTIEGRFYYRLSYVLYVLLAILAITGFVIRNHYIVGIAVFSSIVLVFVDMHYGKKRYGRLALPLVQEGRVLYRLRNAYRILWIKRKYLTVFIFANVCLAVFIAIDYRRLDWGGLVFGALVMEASVLIGLALAKYSERREKD